MKFQFEQVFERLPVRLLQNRGLACTAGTGIQWILWVFCASSFAGLDGNFPIHNPTCSYHIQCRPTKRIRYLDVTHVNA